MTLSPRRLYLIVALSAIVPFLGALGNGFAQDDVSIIATNTLVHWYRCDQDPTRRLPLLSAYLGHVHVADTQWYLEASPELMREAMCRLEQCWEDRP